MKLKVVKEKYSEEEKQSLRERRAIMD